MYYEDKLGELKDLFGTDIISVSADELIVDGNSYPIVDDIIILLKYEDVPKTFSIDSYKDEDSEEFISTIERRVQESFGEEWNTYNKILPEHTDEFYSYFDLVDPTSLRGKRIADLGCGIGRWSYHLRNIAGSMVLIDFSESIFQARNIMRSNNNTIFIMADILNLPFADNCFDFVFSLGVLHHIANPSLDSIRILSRLSNSFLFYLYYDFDNRGMGYRIAFRVIDMIRRITCRVRSRILRRVVNEMFLWAFYVPFIVLGKLLSRAHIDADFLPIYPFYGSMSFDRIRQDVYDRFFTSIEQRISRSQIMSLKDIFGEIRISKRMPYWHFICQK